MQKDKETTPASALVLLPGLMCNDIFWRPLTQVMPATVVDYGDADSLTAMAERALDQAPATFSLAGHSMGGRVALEVVRLAPSRVEKLILMDTGYLPFAGGDKGETEKTGRLALVDVARKDGVRAMCEQWARGMVHPDRLGDKALMESIIAMFERKDAERFARQQKALLERPDGSPVLSALKMPCLILCGRQDSWATVAQHEAMRALAPHARLGIVEDAGHMVLMEQPEATIKAITEFLD